MTKQLEYLNEEGLSPEKFLVFSPAMANQARHITGHLNMCRPIEPEDSIKYFGEDGWIVVSKKWAAIAGLDVMQEENEKGAKIPEKALNDIPNMTPEQAFPKEEEQPAPPPPPTAVVEEKKEEAPAPPPMEVVEQDKENLVIFHRDGTPRDKIQIDMIRTLMSYGGRVGHLEMRGFEKKSNANGYVYANKDGIVIYDSAIENMIKGWDFYEHYHSVMEEALENARQVVPETTKVSVVDREKQLLEISFVYNEKEECYTNGGLKVDYKFVSTASDEEFEKAIESWLNSFSDQPSKKLQEIVDASPNIHIVTVPKTETVEVEPNPSVNDMEVVDEEEVVNLKESTRIDNMKDMGWEYNETTKIFHIGENARTVLLSDVVNCKDDNWKATLDSYTRVANNIIERNKKEEIERVERAKKLVEMTEEVVEKVEEKVKEDKAEAKDSGTEVKSTPKQKEKEALVSSELEKKTEEEFVKDVSSQMTKAHDEVLPEPQEDPNRSQMIEDMDFVDNMSRIFRGYSDKTYALHCITEAMKSGKSDKERIQEIGNILMKL